MIKSGCKRVIALLMTSIMVFSLSSCGKDNKKENGENLRNMKVPEMKDMTYEAKGILLSGATGLADSVEVHGEDMYFTTYKFVEDENHDKGAEEGVGGTVTTGFYKAKTNGTGTQEIKSIEWNEDEYFISWTADEEGNILYLTSGSGGKNGTYTLAKIDNTGNEIFKEEITKKSELNPSEDKNVRIMVDKEKHIVIASERGVFLFDEVGKFTGKVKQKGTMFGRIARTKAGEIVCSSNDDGKDMVLLLDVEKKKWSKEYAIDTVSSKGITSVMNGVDYDFYYSDDSGIYGYDMEKKGAVKIVDYVASNMSGIDIAGLCPMEDEKFMGLDENQTNNSLTIYSKSEEYIEKQTLVLGGLWVAEELKEEVIRFNKNNKRYRIEIKDYNDPEVDQVTKLTMDIMSGAAPDILFLDNVPIDMYAEKGILEDLTLYYENDEELSTDNMIPSVLDTMKIEDGLFYVSPYFRVGSVIGKTEDVGKKMGWTMEEMNAVLEKKGKGIEPFQWESKEMRLEAISNGFTDFVNWETGECQFDTKEFKEILEYANKGIAEEQTKDENRGIYPLTQAVKDGRVLLIESGIGIENIPAYREIMGGDITYIGYPCNDKKGSYFHFSNPLGIYSKSEMKEGAWEFIRMYMTKEYQDNPQVEYSIPTRIDSFDELMEKVVKKDAFTYEFGSIKVDIEDYYADAKPLTQEDVDAFRELVNNTNKIYQSGTPIEDIVVEEAQVYFAGDRDVDETAKIIQGRVTTYVNENR